MKAFSRGGGNLNDSYGTHSSKEQLITVMENNDGVECKSLTIEKSEEKRCCVVQQYQDQEKKTRSIRMKFFSSIGKFFTTHFTNFFTNAKNDVQRIVEPAHRTMIQSLSLGSEYLVWPPRTSTENSQSLSKVFEKNDRSIYKGMINRDGYLNADDDEVREIFQINMYNPNINNGDGGLQLTDAYGFRPVFTIGNLGNTNYSKMIIYVVSEIGYNDALNYAKQYARIIGQMPRHLLKSIQEVWVRKDGYDKYLAIDNKYILIYAEHAKKDDSNGTLEEILFHEATHVFMDPYCRDIKNYFINDNGQAIAWPDAQRMDNKWISEYAFKNPNREDVAESFLAYYAITYRSNKIEEYIVPLIKLTIPNRIKFFDYLIKTYRLEM
jgi:hypothetical protein